MVKSPRIPQCSNLRILGMEVPTFEEYNFGDAVPNGLGKGNEPEEAMRITAEVRGTVRRKEQKNRLGTLLGSEISVPN